MNSETKNDMNDTSAAEKPAYTYDLLRDEATSLLVETGLVERQEQGNERCQ